MGGKFVQCAGNFLGSHLEAAAGTAALGRCMDDVMLESVPPTWPLVTQVYLLGQFDDIYDMTSNIVSHRLPLDPCFRLILFRTFQMADFAGKSCSLK